MAKSVKNTAQRRKLLGEIERLAEIAIFGTLSETYRTCGRAGCDCQGDGPAMVASEFELPRGERQDRRLLCSEGRPRNPREKESLLGSKRTMFARTGGVE